MYLMYLLPMMLGRTFDMNKYTVGVDIFSPEDLKTKVETVDLTRNSYNMQYVHSKYDVQYMREPDTALSLKIKAGLMDIKGPMAYIASVARMVNSMDFIFRFKFVKAAKAVVADPFPGWATANRDQLGTHYVSSIVYGGDLVARIRFTAATKEDLEDIKSRSVGNNILVEGQLERLADELKGKATVEVDYYSHLPIEGVPRTFDGIRGLVHNWSDYMVTENNGLGVPIQVGLDGLDLKDNAFEDEKYLSMEDDLYYFEEEFDDLIETESNMQFWLQKSPRPFTDGEKKQLSEFRERLDSVRGLYNQTIADLDRRKGPHQLERAKTAYEENAHGSRTFVAQFRKLYHSLTQ